MGTSGWTYDWNPEGTFDWYLRNSGLNAVELNTSFYRFPFRSQVRGWARKTSSRRLRWSVKVFRGVTHFRKLGEGALETWRRFRELFEPLDGYVDFYLFQLPPSFAKSGRNVERLRRFASATELGPRFAVEFRHRSWFADDTVDLCRELGITAVSVDSPEARWVVKSSGVVYLRMHGSSSWYAHDYSREELVRVAELVAALRPRKVYVFFNNDHWMLGNAREMADVLRRVLGGTS